MPVAEPMESAFLTSDVVDGQNGSHGLEKRRIRRIPGKRVRAGAPAVEVKPHVAGALERATTLFVEVPQNWPAAHGEKLPE